MVEASAAGSPPAWKKSVARDYFESICIAVIFALFVRTWVVQAFKIPSSSMEDNLLVGDHILVNKFAYGPRPGWLEGWMPYREVERKDVIVFKYPKDARRDFIKRVVAKGGDEVGLSSGQVVLNGQPIDEPYVAIKSPGDSGAPPDYWQKRYRQEHRAPRSIPAGEFFVMGDNRLNSEDSRFWGTVPGGYVKGKALVIYWSFDVPDDLKRLENDGDATSAEKARALGYTFLHFLTRTRWSRTFRVIH